MTNQTIMHGEIMVLYWNNLRRTLIQSVGRMQIFLKLHVVVHIVTTELQAHNVSLSFLISLLFIHSKLFSPCFIFMVSQNLFFFKSLLIDFQGFYMFIFLAFRSSLLPLCFSAGLPVSVLVAFYLFSS